MRERKDIVPTRITLAAWVSAIAAVASAVLALFAYRTSTTALELSSEANRIALESISPQIEVRDGWSMAGEINVCVESDGSTTYQHTVPHVVRISNSGAAPVTLSEISWFGTDLSSPNGDIRVLLDYRPYRGFESFMKESGWEEKGIQMSEEDLARFTFAEPPILIEAGQELLWVIQFDTDAYIHSGMLMELADVYLSTFELKHGLIFHFNDGSVRALNSRLENARYFIDLSETQIPPCPWNS
jgi:hypothetical protein